MLRNCFLLLLVVAASHGQAASERAQALAQRLLIVDTHIDVPNRLDYAYEDVTVATQYGEFDYPRARAGGLNVPFMSIYIPASSEQEGSAWKLANNLVDRVEAMVGRAPRKFAIPHSVDDVLRQHQAGLISLAMGMENGAPLQGDLENLGYFHRRGIRYITLTHSKSNHISDSSYDDNRQWQGLSPFGRELIPAMNGVGMMIDVSHISDAAFYQVMELSRAPVIASHSSARHFTPGLERNMSDDMIRLLAKNKGVIQINFGSFFLTEQAMAWDNTFAQVRDKFMATSGHGRMSQQVRDFTTAYRSENPYPFATLATVLDHIDHVVALAGIDSVGIGSDYDGVGDTLPADLKDVSGFPNLIDGLLARGYSEGDIEKILSGNLLRVWRAVEAFSRAE